MSKRNQAYELYKSSKGKMPLKDIAEKVGASPGTVRAWKSRYKWDDGSESKNVATQRNVTRNATRQKKLPKAVEELNDNDELTESQKLFCLYYLQSFNATQSYMKAYGCGYDVANAHGYKLLSNVVIKKELDRLKLELQSEQYFTIQDIINEYAKQAFADIKDVATFGNEPVEMEDGSIRQFSFVRLKDSNEVDGTLIQEIKQGRDGVSAKMWDKQKALAELMKYLNVGESSNGDEVEDNFLDALLGIVNDTEVWPDEETEA